MRTFGPCPEEPDRARECTIEELDESAEDLEAMTTKLREIVKTRDFRRARALVPYLRAQFQTVEEAIVRLEPE